MGKDDAPTYKLRTGSPESFGWLKRSDKGERCYERPDGKFVIFPPDGPIIVEGVTTGAHARGGCIPKAWSRS